MNKQVLELVYGACIKPDGNGFIATFRDLSNVFSCGETREEAIFNAQEALDGVLLEMVAENLEIPLPSPVQADEEIISVSPEVAAPVMLHILRLDVGQTIANIAQAMEVKYQTYQRMETTGNNLTLKNLKRAARAMGATVELRLRKI
jgi:antitoxin HicB